MPLADSEILCSCTDEEEVQYWKLHDKLNKVQLQDYGVLGSITLVLHQLPPKVSKIINHCSSFYILNESKILCHSVTDQKHNIFKLKVSDKVSILKQVLFLQAVPGIQPIVSATTTSHSIGLRITVYMHPVQNYDKIKFIRCKSLLIHMSDNAVGCDINNNLEAANAAALDSECHILHCRSGCKKTSMMVKSSSNAFRLPYIFTKLKTPYRPISCAGTDKHGFSTDDCIFDRIPTGVIRMIIEFARPVEYVNLAATSRKMKAVADEIVPGMKVTLFAHQRLALSWMLSREGRSNNQLPHPCILPATASEKFPFYIDTVTSTLESSCFRPLSLGIRGGLICDEPGLGKTVTMIALILQTRGSKSSLSDEAYRSDLIQSHERTVQLLRSSNTRKRSVSVSNTYSTSATLIIVPQILLQHWEDQIAKFSTCVLQVYVDKSTSSSLPPAEVLRDCDIVLTTMERLRFEWTHHRPTCALEERAPDRLGFSSNQYINGNERSNVSELLKLHWLRVVFDEGHCLASRSIQYQIEMAKCLSADKRWVMTGTPTPNLKTSSGIKHIQSLLSFLQLYPYGHRNGITWKYLISRSFESPSSGLSSDAMLPFNTAWEKRQDSWLRLVQLLSRIMIRHDKNSLRLGNALPSVVRRVVNLCPSATEFQHYNDIVSAVRGNLVLTKYDPYKPGGLHPDSLLNSLNRKDAMLVLQNIREASCRSREMTPILSQNLFITFLNTVKSWEEEKRIKVVNYVSFTGFGRSFDVDNTNSEYNCEVCNLQLKLLLILPCAHLMCADCLESGINNEGFGCACPVCSQKVDWEELQQLQPGFDYECGSQSENSSAWSGQRRSNNNNNDGIMSTKAAYVTDQILKLQNSVEDHHRRPAKVIIYSQFFYNLCIMSEALYCNNIPYAAISSSERGRDVKTLDDFINDPDVRVLLLSNVGSHGLDLSFVTNIYLMDVIWDKSIETQVIARAHRIIGRPGLASSSSVVDSSSEIVVESLVLRGTVEEELYKYLSHSDDDNSPLQSEKKATALFNSLRNLKRENQVFGNCLQYSVYDDTMKHLEDVCVPLRDTSSNFSSLPTLTPGYSSAAVTLATTTASNPMAKRRRTVTFAPNDEADENGPENS